MKMELLSTRLLLLGCDFIKLSHDPSLPSCLYEKVRGMMEKYEYIEKIFWQIIDIPNEKFSERVISLERSFDNHKKRKSDCLGNVKNNNIIKFPKRK